MPSVSPTHGWILWEIAKSRLQSAGYRVEKHGARLAAYHGIGLTTCFPDFLTIQNGKCSPRTVDRLIKKIKASGS